MKKNFKNDKQMTMFTPYFVSLSLADPEGAGDASPRPKISSFSCSCQEKLAK